MTTIGPSKSYVRPDFCPRRVKSSRFSSVYIEDAFDLSALRLKSILPKNLNMLSQKDLINL